MRNLKYKFEKMFRKLLKYNFIKKKIYVPGFRRNDMLLIFFIDIKNE